MNYALLTNDGPFTIFRFGNDVLKFAAPYSLDHYEEIISWENGLITVMTKYNNTPDLEEEYIDIGEILDNLNYNTEAVLNNITEVRLGKFDENGEVVER